MDSAVFFPALSHQKSIRKRGFSVIKDCVFGKVSQLVKATTRIFAPYLSRIFSASSKAREDCADHGPQRIITLFFPLNTSDETAFPSMVWARKETGVPAANGSSTGAANKVNAIAAVIIFSSPKQNTLLIRRVP